MKDERLWENATGILVAIRDEKATDWKSLCELCNLRPRTIGTALGVLTRNFRQLVDAGLVAFDTLNEDQIESFDMFDDVSFHTTALAHKIQSALDVSLKDISKFHRHSSMVVNPQFGRPKENENNLDLFVLMPFAEEFQPIYEDHIKPIAKSLSLEVARADDFFTDDSIVADIWNAINKARVIIADCSGRNPNVFYEIGIAHVVGKPVVLLAQREEDVPFDLLHLRHIRYDYTPRGMSLMEKNLHETISYMLRL